MWRLVPFALLAAAVVLGLYGLLALLYRGESGGGETYVSLFGREVDAQLAGAIVLAVALALGAYALRLLRSHRS